MNCNAACITCRDNLIQTSDEQKNLIIKKIWSVLPDIETILLNTAGDVFASKHSSFLLSKIAKNFPHIKYNIDTNLILCSLKKYKEMNLENKIDKLNCSIPGYTKETYEKIVKYGNYKNVMQNIKDMAEEKSKGHIKEINIIMVFHKLNYREMPQIANLAKELNINVIFSAYQPWENTKLANEYSELAVFLPKHQEYQNFIKIITQNDMYGQHINFEPNIIKLRENLQTL